MAEGFTGKYAIIDLTTGTTEVIKPEAAFYRKFLSGYGLGAAVILERQEPGIHPLAPESHLGFCTGLLTGTGAFFSGRFMVVAKSPLTGGWGDANAGGFFSRELKRAGFDALFFTGAAKKPVWVNVTETSVEINDGTDLWGQDIVATEKHLKELLGDKKVQIASIGVAGEKRSLISGIATDEARIAARSGLGAVMGSKLLKAVVVRGKQPVEVAEKETLKSINKRFIADFKKSKLLDRLTLRFMNTLSKVIARTGVSVPAQASLVREVYKKYGTSGLTVYSAMTGDMPIKNWDGVGHLDYTFQSALKNSDENVLKHQKRRYACQACPLGCGGIIDIRKGRYKGSQGHKPEYETLGAFGGLILNDDLDSIIELNEMCNRAGIDTISTGGTIAFAIECFENGIIDEKTTGGLKLAWGRMKEIIALTEMIINRSGFGDVLADGVKRAAEKIGGGSEKFAVHAGGQELPMHDSRLDPGFAIAYECEPTPGRHTISCYLYAGLFGVRKKFPQANRMIRQARGPLAKNIQKYVAGSFYMQLLNCSGMCMFGGLTSSLPLVEYINAATGWNLSPDEYLKTGERILSLRKAFNVREGIKSVDHDLNGRALGESPMEKGPLKGVTIDMQGLKDGFFKTVGWDPFTGGPTPEKLKELEIDSLFSQWS
jgi:aldehyde:ferredoxin oxidoreductase